jgi:hypothetical protein
VFSTAYADATASPPRPAANAPLCGEARVKPSRHPECGGEGGRLSNLFLGMQKIHLTPDAGPFWGEPAPLAGKPPPDPRVNRQKRPF